MTFNIEWGGDNISFDKVVEAIRAAEADVVGIQEPLGNLRRLAGELGWYHDEPSYAISKYPLLPAPHADGRYVFVELRPGQVVALANVHLPSDPEGPAMVRDGATPEAVLEVERSVRLPEILPYLDSLAALPGNSIPVFLTGDFNAPSHSDWTEATVGARPFLRYPLDWPVSRAVAAAGFRDAWREAHPDPKRDPGLTWWARRPPLAAYAPGPNDPEQRIDFVWFAGDVELVSSELVGETGFPGVSISVDPWPSDHRAVVSAFVVNPADVPPLLAARQRVYRVGDDIEIVYRQAGGSAIRLNAAVIVDAVAGDGDFRIASDRLLPGRYALQMEGPDGESLEYDFWLQAADAVPAVSVEGDVFDAGEAIPVTWQNGPGFRNDYLSVAKQGTVADYDGGDAWAYIDALPEGRIELAAATVDSGWPLPPGDYVVRLVEDDGNEVLAESAVFTVR